jgi:hypothetical protein
MGLHSTVNFCSTYRTKPVAYKRRVLESGVSRVTERFTARRQEPQAQTFAGNAAAKAGNAAAKSANRGSWALDHALGAICLGLRVVTRQ